MSGHAPGPWKYAANLCDSGFDIGPCLPDGTLDELALLAFTTTGGEEAEANARLMAAAPDLLMAVRIAISLLAEPIPMRKQIEHAIAVLRRAWEKAEGEPP